MEINAHLQSLERSIATQQKEKAEEQNSLSRSESLKAGYQATVTTLNNTIANNQAVIKEIEENSVYIHENKSNFTLRLDAINKFITIANRDFRGYLLKYVIDFIYKISKDFCMDILNTYLFDYDIEGYNIEIRYSG